MDKPRFLMCAPRYFGVHYIINPWMEGQIDATCGEVATQQWEDLHGILSAYATVELLPPVADLPDLVFTANAALIYRQLAVLSSFRCPERQAEEPFFRDWLETNGFQIFTLPREVCFEGAGDALLDRARPLLWMGHGMRSSLSALPYLERALGLEIQPLELGDKRFYHLDTCFCPLEGGLLMYYPGAFRPQSLQAIESRVPAEMRFALCDESATRFSCNAVSIGGAVILNYASGDLREWLEARGRVVVETSMTEFLKAGGAAKCLSLRLDESYR